MLPNLRPATEDEIAREAKAESERRRREEADRRVESWRRFIGATGDRGATEESLRYGRCTLSNFIAHTQSQVNAIEACREYLATIDDRLAGGEGILFYGPSGTGKDHLAIGILREAIGKHGFTCERVNGSDWFGEIRDAIDTDKVSERQLVERLCRPQFLLISDPLPPIGALTQHQATMLYRVVEARYYRQRPTIVTVNIGGRDEAEKRMGVATWDRLKGGSWVIACDWDSFRRPARYVNAPEGK